MEYTYEDYLQAWEDQFGEETDNVLYRYYHYGKPVSCTLTRLTEEEFNEHKTVYDKADAMFDAAYAACNDEALEAALDKSFPHEVAMLI